MEFSLNNQLPRRLPALVMESFLAIVVEHFSKHFLEILIVNLLVSLFYEITGHLKLYFVRYRQMMLFTKLEEAIHGQKSFTLGVLIKGIDLGNVIYGILLK